MQHFCLLFYCSYYMYNITSTWTRVTLPLPQEAFTASTQFRWSGQESCPTCQFSLDNGMYMHTSCIITHYHGVIVCIVYIRPGCPNNCHNQGTCVNGECR